MEMLHQRFENTMVRIGFAGAQLPTAVFYHVPVGIRFEVGGGEDVYLPERMGWNPVYVDNAFHRAKTLLGALPCRPDLLRIDSYPQEADNITLPVLARLGLPAPDESVQGRYFDGEESCRQEHLYWDLTRGRVQTDSLLCEIIKGDLGGLSCLTSNVYFLSTEASVLYHLYDDRGADVAAADRELLRPLYQTYGDWILAHNRVAIDRLFALNRKMSKKPGKPLDNCLPRW